MCSGVRPKGCYAHYVSIPNDRNVDLIFIQLSLDSLYTFISFVPFVTCLFLSVLSFISVHLFVLQYCIGGGGYFPNTYCSDFAYQGANNGATNGYGASKELIQASVDACFLNLENHVSFKKFRSMSINSFVFPTRKCLF